MLWIFGSKKKQKRQMAEMQRQQRNGGMTVAEYSRGRNEIVTERSKAIKELETNQSLSPHDRFKLLVKTYRADNEVMIIPQDWSTPDKDREGYLLQTEFKGTKIFVETPQPSMVRRR